MDVFLVRHAVADEGEDDFARPLSKKGKKGFERVVQGLDAWGLRAAVVLHSPRLRALQTAELLAKHTKAKLEVCGELDGPPTEALLAKLEGRAVALVGHEPHLSSLLAWLVVGDRAHGGAFALKKGAVAYLEGEPTPGGMRLSALLPPSASRALR